MIISWLLILFLLKSVSCVRDRMSRETDKNFQLSPLLLLLNPSFLKVIWWIALFSLIVIVQNLINGSVDKESNFTFQSQLEDFPEFRNYSFIVSLINPISQSHLRNYWRNITDKKWNWQWNKWPLFCHLCVFIKQLLANLLQCHTPFKIQNNCKGAKNGQWGQERVSLQWFFAKYLFGFEHSFLKRHRQ